MEYIFGSIALGIEVGYFRLLPKSWTQMTQKFIFVSMIGMVTALGAKIGNDHEVLRQVSLLGWQSLVIGILAVIGSIFALWLMNQVWPFHIDEKEDEQP